MKVGLKAQSNLNLKRMLYSKAQSNTNEQTNKQKINKQTKRKKTSRTEMGNNAELNVFLNQNKSQSFAK